MTITTGKKERRTLRYAERADAPERVINEWLTQRHWSETMYLEMAERENVYVELDDGKVVFHTMPTTEHQTIVLNLATALREYARALPAPGRALLAPTPVRLWPLKMREPDVMFFKAEHLDRIGTQQSGPPDFVAEVLSPSTHGLDIEQKMTEYALAGIPEYWVIDPERHIVSVYVLEGEEYHLVTEYSSGHRAQAQTLSGFSVAVEDVWQP